MSRPSANLHTGCLAGFEAKFDSSTTAFSAGSFPGGVGRDAVVECPRSGRSMMGPTVHTPNYALFTFQDDGITPLDR